MIDQIAKKIVDAITPIIGIRKLNGLDYLPKANQLEMMGSSNNNHFICTVEIHQFSPREEFGEGGHFYTKTRKRKVKDKETKKWTYVEEEVTYYEMSEADMKFIYQAYVNDHLDQRQISRLSGIPQPYVYRYIKHKKLKPRYPKIEKTQRIIDLLDKVHLEGSDNYKERFTMSQRTVEVPDDSELEAFRLDPHPTRSEWKVRREEYGLKNGENWRNSPMDENPGPKQYGDGSTVRRKKEAKLRRREERRKKNIRKFNLHQNNRYGMTYETEGIKKENEKKEVD